MSFLKEFRSIFVTIFASFSLLFLSSWLGIFVVYLMPIPFVMYGYNRGLKKGLWVTIVTSFFTIFLQDPTYYFLAILGGTLGSVMGHLYHRKSIIPPIVGGFLTGLIHFISLLAFIRYVLQVDIVDYLQNTMLSEVDLLMQQIGMNQLQGNNAFDELVELAGLTLPIMIIFSSLFLVVIVHFLSRFLFKRNQVEIPNFPPLQTWMLPKSIFYYYVVVLILMVIPDVSNEYVMKLVLLNLYPILQFLLMLQGLSFVLFYSSGKGWNKIKKSLAVMGLVLFHSFFPILDFIGFMDLGFNLRKKLTFRG